jgi:hypothetical protein
MPFWTETGRNQPQGEKDEGTGNSDAVFLLSLPASVRGVIRPPERHTIVEVDFSSQDAVKKIRNDCKVCMLASIYGQKAYGLSRRLGCSINYAIGMRQMLAVGRRGRTGPVRFADDFAVRVAAARDGANQDQHSVELQSAKRRGRHVAVIDNRYAQGWSEDMCATA